MSKPGTSLSFFPAGEEVIMGSVLPAEQILGQSRPVLPAEATDESEEALKIGAEGS